MTRSYKDHKNPQRRENQNKPSKQKASFYSYRPTVAERKEIAEIALDMEVFVETAMELTQHGLSVKVSTDLDTGTQSMYVVDNRTGNWEQSRTISLRHNELSRVFQIFMYLFGKKISTDPDEWYTIFVEDNDVAW